MAKNLDNIQPVKKDVPEKDETPIVETPTTEEPVTDTPTTETTTTEVAPPTETVTTPPETPAIETTPEVPPITTPETPSTMPSGMPGAIPTDMPDATSNANTENYDSMFPEPSVVIGKPPSWVWWLILLISSLIIAFVGYQLLGGKIDNWLSVTPSNKNTTIENTNSSSGTTVSSSPSTEVSPITSPTASTQPTASTSTTPQTTNIPSSTVGTKADITLRILNGTNTSGAAATVKTKLEASGYKVRTVGNAQTRDYTQTIIYYQKAFKNAALDIQSTLTQYQSKIEESTLANPDNVLIIIGAK